MATHIELYDLTFEPPTDANDMRKIITTSVLIKAHALLKADPPPSATALRWASNVTKDRVNILNELDRFWPLVLAAAEEAAPNISVPALLAVPEATIQTYVNGIADVVAENYE